LSGFTPATRRRKGKKKERKKEREKEKGGLTSAKGQVFQSWSGGEWERGSEGERERVGA